MDPVNQPDESASSSAVRSRWRRVSEAIGDFASSSLERLLQTGAFDASHATSQRHAQCRRLLTAAR